MVVAEENGLLQFQLEYHELPPYFEFFCSGGLCDAGRKGFSLSVYFGKVNLWSARDLERLGPAGMALGNAKKSVKRAKTPRPIKRMDIRRWPIRSWIVWAIIFTRDRV